MYLRSPAVHHLDIGPWSLKDFAGEHENFKLAQFTPHYDRPNLTLFNAHCDQVIDTFDLHKLHIQSHVISCCIRHDHVHAHLADGQDICALNIVFATGSGDQPE